MTTRRKRAEELLARLKRGPVFIEDAGQMFPYPRHMTVAEMRNAWALWCETWITPELVDLIKELRPPAPTAEEVSDHMKLHNVTERVAIMELIDRAYDAAYYVPSTSE